jgi:anthranilate synthase component I
MYPTLEEVKRLARSSNLVPVYREIVADLETPVSAYLKLRRGGYSFLLESVEGGDRIGRYSFIGTEPYRTIRVESTLNCDPLAAVRNEIKRYATATIPGLPKFTGGAVGYVGYEAVTRFEELPSPDSDGLGLPIASFMLSDSLLVFDHVTHKIKVVAHVHAEEDIEASYRLAASKIDEMVARLRGPLPSGEVAVAAGSTPTQSSNYSKSTFEQAVNKIKSYITAGEAIQVVLSQRITRATSARPFEIYRALRTINPSPYMFFLDFDGFQLIGASPEILVRVDGDTVVTRPLAGTRPRGKSPEEDIRLENELRNDEKERAEHIMLVDLGRNDIGRVSKPGTVEVSELMDVERYSHVMHLVTNVQGKLRPGMDAFDALRACFPAGTVSGAPKIRAMEIIAELEPQKRGAYAGAAGYFAFSGNMDMAIAIRTIVFKDRVAYLQAGGGIVYDSVPEREYEESLNKAQATLKAIEQAEAETRDDVNEGGVYAGANRQL